MYFTKNSKLWNKICLNSERTKPSYCCCHCCICIHCFYFYSIDATTVIVVVVAAWYESSLLLPLHEFTTSEQLCICNVLIKTLKMAWISHFFRSLLPVITFFHIVPSLFACLDAGWWNMNAASVSMCVVCVQVLNVCAWWMPISNAMDIEFYCFVLSSRQMCNVYVYHTLFSTYTCVLFSKADSYSYWYACIQQEYDGRKTCDMREHL